MIIWLASYPKSGNTWVRLFLEILLFSQNKDLDINKTNIRLFPLKKDFDGLTSNVDDIEEFVSNCLISQEKVNLDNKIKIFKTHNAYWKSGDYSFTNEENTHGIIYVVRDPRNVITSLKNHFNKKDYNKAYEMIINEKTIIGSDKKKTEFDLPTVISSWSNHYNSWKKMKKNYLLIKYEELLNNPIFEFRKITNFLKNIYKIDFNDEQINTAIEKCNFDNLTEQENKSGFIEASIDENGRNKKFFYLGPKNNWQSLLDKKISIQLQTVFKDEMEELGYL